MPNYASISYEMKEEDFNALKKAIMDLSAKIGEFALDLHIQDKRSLASLGNRSLPFTEQAYKSATNWPDFVPAYLDMEEFKRDFTLCRQCKELMNLVGGLEERLMDTYIASGADAFSWSRTFYQALKAAVKANKPNAEMIHDELAKRFAKIKGKAGGNGDTQPEGSKPAVSGVDAAAAGEAKTVTTPGDSKG